MTLARLFSVLGCACVPGPTVASVHCRLSAVFGVLAFLLNYVPNVGGWYSSSGCEVDILSSVPEFVQ